METKKIWRIEFETGDTLNTEDEALAELHRERGRSVTEIDSTNPNGADKTAARHGAGAES